MAYTSFLDLDEWMKFYERIIHIYPLFFIRLAEVHPDLTKHNIKLCALILFECEDTEIKARLAMNSIEAVLTAKSRLRKKFKLKETERLVNYLQRIAAGIIVPPPRKSLAASGSL